jgi:hypothetical protein
MDGCTCTCCCGCLEEYDDEEDAGAFGSESSEVDRCQAGFMLDNLGENLEAEDFGEVVALADKVVEEEEEEDDGFGDRGERAGSSCSSDLELVLFQLLA